MAVMKDALYLAKTIITRRDVGSLSPAGEALIKDVQIDCQRRGLWYRDLSSEKVCMAWARALGLFAF